MRFLKLLSIVFLLGVQLGFAAHTKPDFGHIPFEEETTTLSDMVAQSIGLGYEFVVPVASSELVSYLLRGSSIYQPSVLQSASNPVVGCVLGFCYLLSMLDAYERMLSLSTGYEPKLAWFNQWNPLYWPSMLANSQLEQAKNNLLPEGNFKESFEIGREKAKSYITVKNGIMATYSLARLLDLTAHYLHRSNARNREAKELVLAMKTQETSQSEESMQLVSSEHKDKLLDFEKEFLSDEKYLLKKQAIRKKYELELDRFALNEEQASARLSNDESDAWEEFKKKYRQYKQKQNEQIRKAQREAQLMREYQQEEENKRNTQPYKKQQQHQQQEQQKKEPKPKQSFATAAAAAASFLPPKESEKMVGTLTFFPAGKQRVALNKGVLSPKERASLDLASEMAQSNPFWHKFTSSLKAGSDPDIAFPKEHQWHGQTWLHRAVLDGKLDALKLLLDHEASSETPFPESAGEDVKGLTALQYLISKSNKNNDDIKMILMLTENGAQIDGNFLRELEYKSTENRFDVEALKILKLSAEISKVSDLTPLQVLVVKQDKTNDEIEMIRFLIEKGSDLNRKYSPDQFTPYWAQGKTMVGALQDKCGPTRIDREVFECLQFGIQNQGEKVDDNWFQGRRSLVQLAKMPAGFQCDNFLARLIWCPKEDLEEMIGDNPHLPAQLPAFLTQTLIRELQATETGALVDKRATDLKLNEKKHGVFLHIPKATKQELTRFQRELIILVDDKVANLQLLGAICPLEVNLEEGTIGPFELRFVNSNEKEGTDLNSAKIKVLSGVSNFGKWHGVIKNLQEGSLFHGDGAWPDELLNVYSDLAGIEDFKGELPAIELDDLKVKFLELKHSKNLNQDSVLAFRGPPGTGKTQVIKELISVSLGEGQTNVVIANSYEPLREILRRLDGVLGVKPILVSSVDEYWKGKFPEEIIKHVRIKPNRAHGEDEELKKELADFYQHLKLSNVWLVTTYSLSSVAGIIKNSVNLFIDEAGKMSRMDFAYVADQLLKKYDSRVVVVGDEKQLPPFSQLPIVSGGSKEIFSAILSKYPSYMLPNTRRFGTGLAELISHFFYDGQLKTLKETPTPVKFIAHHGTKSQEGTSIKNTDEAHVVLRHIMKNKVEGANTYAVVCLYLEQMNEVIALLKEEKYSSLRDHVNVLTVDSSQGREYDVVYVLTSVSGDSRADFVHNPNRLNVALSRAKEACYLVGNHEFFNDMGKNKLLKKIYDFIKEREPQLGEVSSSLSSAAAASRK